MDHTEHIGYRMRYFNQCMKRLIDQKKRVREATYGMSMTDSWILRYLDEHEGQEVLQKNIETDLHIKKSALTQHLNEMESNGLIRRSISEHDSRYKCISRTEKAIEIHQQIMDEIEEHERLMRKGIDEKDLAVFSRVLDQMIENISGEPKPVHKK
ncbi:MAG: MarR family transcriptional regulator [bacterium]|nr:MarR family transcriptional regulator [bacterium]MDY4100453.1 MarR family transcriptional regulator [Lachnospiraceae bacterium]